MIEIWRERRVQVAGLFLGFFALYAYLCAPSTAPYRDAGEMISVLSTLGVAHPPGYPLYTLMGKLASALLPGNVAYRVNIFSALCGAGALVFLFLTLRRWIGSAPALLATAFFGFSNPFLELCVVSEMYALGLLWVGLLFYAAFVLENTALWAFLMGAALGVRMDLMLIIPVFLLVFWRRKKLDRPLMLAGCFAAGLSIYFYLPIRSLQDPLIDWANPDSILGLFNSARRKNYSGTLDLLSLSYKQGENFAANVRLYLNHLAASFGWAGAALGVAGAWRLYHLDRLRFLFFWFAFLITGPLFLYLANMPPNPHAVAIIEASYPMPDLLFAVFIGFGIYWFIELVRARRPGMSATGRIRGGELLGRGPDVDAGTPGSRPKACREDELIVIAAVLVALGWNAWNGIPKSFKRTNFFVRDYVVNVFRSAPPKSILVLHKDVQLFALWEAQLVGKRRLDVSLISNGLSASPWYWEMKKRWGSPLTPEAPVKLAGGWDAMKNSAPGRRLLAGYETDIDPATKLNVRHHGLLADLQDAATPNDPAADYLLNDFMIYRGRYRYGTSPDFFTSDLIGDHARAYDRQGFDLMNAGQMEKADWYFRRAESLDPAFARPSSNRGYLWLVAGKLDTAYDCYLSAIRKYQDMLVQARQYNTLPDVVKSIKSDLSGVYINMGAVEERLGRVEGARDYYQASFQLLPNAQAHYNMGVTYWKKDWSKAAEHMEAALRLAPQWEEARKQLNAALYFRQQERSK